MGRIVVSENVSLDGVVQDPSGDEGFELGGWFEQMSPEDRQAWAGEGLDEALAADAILIGRHSDHFFGSRWNQREGAWADRLNALPKYVVSSTLEQPEWVNGTVLGGDVVDEVANLRQKYERDVLVVASFQLVRTLFAHDLVDELRLTVHPCVLGSGDRMFADSGPKGLRLLHHRGLGEHLTHVAYEVVRPAAST
jgi:dihydrofolate reductase